MRKMMLFVLGTLLVVGSATTFTDDGSRRIRLRLSGYEEAPNVISTLGNGRFSARLTDNDTKIAWTLSYDDLEGSVLQAHIHFGARHIASGISVFLCTNLTPPAGVPAPPLCPPSPGTISGESTAANVLGPAGQGIEPAAFDELVAAIRAGQTYVNVHTSKWPTGEIRAQLPGSDDGDHDHNH